MRVEHGYERPILGCSSTAILLDALIQPKASML
jgi:hypothetical protein